jgi:endonuclease/exonuclease/phosphatase (EEP) superfamily protein YafD
LGDLNTTPWSYHYHAFIRTSGLENASKGRGLHPTWPTFAPPLWIPLDHALHTDDLTILKKTVGPDVGSDHYPIRVDFALGASKE